jgi:hypothetical protein
LGICDPIFGWMARETYDRRLLSTLAACIEGIGPEPQECAAKQMLTNGW